MHFTQYFASMAHDLAKQKGAKAARLERERSDLRAQLAKVEGEISIAKDASTRAETYPIVGSETICPVCWINGKQSYVRAIGGGTREHDLFRCGGCNDTFEVPVR